MESRLNLDSPSVIAHIEMLQGIINRMGGNSSNCKNMAIAAIVGILALSTSTELHKFIFCGVFVVALFLIDAMYLGLERYFKIQQNDFIEKLNAGDAVKPFEVESSHGQRLTILWSGMKSWSTAGFYLILLVVCAVVSLTLS